MADHLRTTGREWTRQAQWGFRLFDFWNRDLGIAVEVDGPGHDLEADTASDRSNLVRSAIVVLRVRNYNEQEAASALEAIRTAEPWNVRRELVGLKAIR